MNPASPVQIGRYRIERELGRGAMGVVYQATDTALGRTVALKTFGVMAGLPPTDRETFEQRFLTEARIAATLEDRNVVTVYDVGRDTESGLLFMALEYVRGETLADALARGPLPWPRAARIIATVARSLQTAHAQHIVHRDIKPANIMVTTAGEPKLMDFGIAKASASQLTLAGQVFGTPAYMSPEQASGEEVDGRSDVFSLGVVLYELVTNTRPFEGVSMAATLSRILRDEPRPASSVAAIPRALDAILTQALKKSRDQRYQSASELADALENVTASHASGGLGIDLPGTVAVSPAASAAPRASRPLPPEPTPPGVPNRGSEVSNGPLSPKAAGVLVAVAVVALAGAWFAYNRRAPSAGAGAGEAGLAVTPVSSEAPSKSVDSSPNVPAPAGAVAPAPQATATAEVLSVSGPAQAVSVGFDIRHAFASGSVRVRVDDAVIFADRLSGLPLRKEGVTTGYLGRFTTDLRLPRGPHMVKVEIRSGSLDLEASIRVDIQPGERRRLVAAVGDTLALSFE